MKIKVIYHADCIDGFTAAYAIWLKYPEAEFIPYNYQMKIDPNNYHNNILFITDFSFPRNIITALKETVTELLIIDHHKSAERELKDLPYVIFDNNESGATLTWRHFHKTDPPLFFQYVKDRDLWHHRLENSKEINAYIRSMPRTFKSWKKTHEQFNNIKESMKQHGTVILQHIDSSVDYILTKAYDCTLVGKRARAINSAVYISELGDKILQDDTIDIAIIYYDDGPNQLVALRSKKYDVSKVAAIWDGGGHIQAAGFSGPRYCPYVWECSAYKQK